MHRHFATIVMVFCFVAPAAGDNAGKTSGRLPSALVAGVMDGDTFGLDREIDGRTAVRLVGIQAPKRSAGRPDSGPKALAENARDTLADLVLNRTVGLRFTGPRTDRHGRLLAHAYRDDGAWIQGEMLERGLARVLSFEDNPALAAEMLALEDAARKQGLGIWSDSFYAVRAPEQAGKDIGSFQIVEGRIVKAARVKRYVYLNFGADWRTDFTVSVPVKHLRRFSDAGLDLLTLSGRDIRVRGWLKEYNGPMIDATHPEQIEVLGSSPPE